MLTWYPEWNDGPGVLRATLEGEGMDKRFPDFSIVVTYGEEEEPNYGMSNYVSTKGWGWYVQIESEDGTEFYTDSDQDKVYKTQSSFPWLCIARVQEVVEEYIRQDDLKRIEKEAEDEDTRG